MMQLNNTISASITAIGGYVPEERLTNKDLESIVDTNDEWIQSRTGIKAVSYTHLTLPTKA